MTVTFLGLRHLFSIALHPSADSKVILVNDPAASAAYRSSCG